jgi:hypothetical protein
MSWREDNRRKNIGEFYQAIANAAPKHPVSRQWKAFTNSSLKNNKDPKANYGRQQNGHEGHQ